MQTAFYPGTSRIITVAEFLKQAGPKWRSKGLFPVCPGCKRQLYIWGGHDPSVGSRFHHRPGETDCKLASDDPRYRWLTDGPRDDRGRARRADFFLEENVRRAYAGCLNLCGSGNLSAAAFAELIRIADAVDIWSYRHLPLWAIPFVLLTLDDFTGTSRQGKGMRFRFVFEKPAKTGVDALWLRPEECLLKKVFADSGKAMRHGEFALSETRAQQYAGDTSWMSGRLVQALCSPRDG